LAIASTSAGVAASFVLPDLIAAISVSHSDLVQEADLIPSSD
jgi:hypothetical protein